MATQKNVPSKTNRLTFINQYRPLQTALFSVFGLVIGFIAALAIVLPAAQPASARPLSTQLTATHETSCVQPNSTVAVKPKVHHKSSFISQLTSGQLVKNVAVIRDTGPDSSNKVVIKTINDVHIENTNTVNFVTSNDQSSTSGSAKVSDNTNAGGAYAGNANTSNITDAWASISN